MRNRWIQFFILLLTTVFFVTGCATARPRKVEPQAEVHNQISSMQSELTAKDQQIQDLQYQLEQSKYSSTSNYTPSYSSSKSSVIRAKGVSGIDVQRALKRAGFEPGPIDGRIGKKTKAAIKAFQRSQGLKADGVVGDKTWSLLQA